MIRIQTSGIQRAPVDVRSFPNVSPEKEGDEDERKAGRHGWREVHRLYQRMEVRGRRTEGRRQRRKTPNAQCPTFNEEAGGPATAAMATRTAKLRSERAADTPAKEGPNLTGNVSNHPFTHLGIDPQPAIRPSRHFSA